MRQQAKTETLLRNQDYDDPGNYPFYETQLPKRELTFPTSVLAPR